MTQHVKILGVLYIAFSVMVLLLAIGLAALAGGVAGIVALVAQEDPDAALAVPILGAAAFAFFGVFTAAAIPGLALGIGLVKFKPWARILGLIFSALNLLAFPVGTLLGGYGLWVLLHKESEALFT